MIYGDLVIIPELGVGVYICDMKGVRQVWCAGEVFPMPEGTRTPVDTGEILNTKHGYSLLRQFTNQLG